MEEIKEPIIKDIFKAKGSDDTADTEGIWSYAQDKQTATEMSSSWSRQDVIAQQQTATLKQR